MNTLNPPQAKLDRDWNVGSLADVKTALQWLAWMDAAEKHVNATIADEVQKIHDRYAPLLEVGGNGRKRLTFADLRKLLQQAITEYCKEHRDEVLADQGKNKSRKFETAGTIGWKDQKQQVGTVEEGQSESACLKALVSGLSIQQAIESWLQRQVVWRDVAGNLHLSPAHRLKDDQQASKPDTAFGEFRLVVLLGLKPALDKAAIAKSVKAGELRTAQLEATGLKLFTPPEKFEIKPAAWKVQSESEQRDAA